MANATCLDGEESFLSCTVEDGRKTLSVCLAGETATYRFGPRGGAPELEMVRDIGLVDYTPWAGVGRAIWEEVVFHNGSYSYLVYGSIDRLPPVDDDGVLVVDVGGGVTVMRSGQELAAFDCDPGTSDFNYSEILGETKEAAGYCWDRNRFAWVLCN